jgi:hypothetical protein
VAEAFLPYYRYGLIVLPHSGQVKSWIKVKNPASPAMLRIVEGAVSGLS